MNRNIPIEELHSFLDAEINKAIIQIRTMVNEDKLSADGVIRSATEINVLERIKAKYYKEEN